MTKKKEQPGFFSYENIRSLSVLILIIFALRWSVGSPYHVPTASMEPTIKVGDRLLAWKLAYNLKLPFTDVVLAEWGKPQVGDIIVFKYPRDPDIDYVKRVVATAGQTVQLIDNILYVDGEPQPREDHNTDTSILEDIHDNAEIKTLFVETLNDRKHWVIQNRPGKRRFTSANWPLSGKPYTVPESSVFVIGDNRDNSQDSRVWEEVPMSYIRGKALFVIWSVFTPANENWPKFRFGRFGHWLDSLNT